MKKSVRILSVLLVVLMVTSFAGCGKKDTLVGEWTIESTENKATNEGKKTVIESLQKWYYIDGEIVQIKENGEYVVGAEISKWEEKDGEFVLTNTSGNSSSNKYSLEKNKLIIEMADGDFVVNLIKKEK